MNLTRLTWVALIALVWTSMLSFGGVAAETVMLYPNIFVDPPASLERAREFVIAGGPSDYFPPLGAGVVVCSVAALLLTWRNPRLRWWIAAAAATFFLCEFVFSAVFFWPRNEIMFVDPLGTHSADELRKVAAEFVAGHWVRVAGGAVTAVLAFTALLRWARTAPPTAAGGAR
ncbi:anthrone oxygenase family protein [Catellatospora aurea]|uniref:Anthrone oxygenase family protein n=1 Tax=Catellatospora aurea TaxID=1337874 RepID=A0ABW2GZJ0_9ACTN